MTKDMDLTTTILKVIATVIAVVTAIIWVLEGLTWDMGLAASGSALAPLFLNFVLLIVSLGIIAGTIAIWIKPLLAGIGFLFVSFPMIGCATTGADAFSNLLIPIALCICAVLMFVIWWREKKNMDIGESSMSE